MLFFFKQKTAYEMRISDWSSDVCFSDLGEMTIMAVFMVMFMMNPAGLNPMTMVHQHRTAVVSGLVSFVALAGVVLVSDFPDRPVDRGQDPTEGLGVELLGESRLIFEIAGVALLGTMLGAIALAGKRGRSGDALAR